MGFKSNFFPQKIIEFLPQTVVLNPHIFGTHWRRPEIFQTMNSVRSNALSFKYQRFTQSGVKDIKISCGKNSTPSRIEASSTIPYLVNTL